MRYDAFIFDLDGTLLDTLDDLRNAVNFGLREYGFPEKTREEIRAAVGYGSERLIAACLPMGREEPKYQAVFDCYLARYLAHGQELTAPYPGIPELLAELKSLGGRLAIVSNKPHAATAALTARYFGGLIETSVGDRRGVRRKPAPDAVLAAMEELGVPAERSVYIGDSEVDVRTAESAGIPCVSVSYGFRTREQLIDAGAKLIVPDAESLLAELIK